VDLGRVRKWEWFTGLAGIVLLVSLFLPWYGAEGTTGTATAWESFAVVDLLLAVAALVAIAHPIVTATQRTSSLPQTVSAFVVWFGIAAMVAALVRLIDPPGLTLYAPAENGGNLETPLIGTEVATTREIGVWLGFVAVAAVFAGGWKSMRDKHFPQSMRPLLRVETIATPTPDGERRDTAG
jgi:hypothetical protein